MLQYSVHTIKRTSSADKRTMRLTRTHCVLASCRPATSFHKIPAPRRSDTRNQPKNRDETRGLPSLKTSQEDALNTATPRLLPLGFTHRKGTDSTKKMSLPRSRNRKTTKILTAKARKIPLVSGARNAERYGFVDNMQPS